MPDTLIVLIGPTGVGKTELSLSIAEHFRTSIVSADSRQLYADLKIGTAALPPSNWRVFLIILSEHYS
jgi:miaA: tRNA delta(2)-isopentenylpyrophosphate transferase